MTPPFWTCLWWHEKDWRGNLAVELLELVVKAGFTTSDLMSMDLALPSDSGMWLLSSSSVILFNQPCSEKMRIMGFFKTGIADLSLACRRSLAFALHVWFLPYNILDCCWHAWCLLTEVRGLFLADCSPLVWPHENYCNFSTWDEGDPVIIWTFWILTGRLKAWHWVILILNTVLILCDTMSIISWLISFSNLQDHTALYGQASPLYSVTGRKLPP